MKIILLQDVRKLGNKGDVLEVSDGYARNFLLPRGLAVEASEGRLKELSAHNQQMAQKIEKEKEKAHRIGEKIGGKTVVVKAKCGEGGKLFGTVTSKEVADALKEQYKVDVDKKKIEIKEPMKHIGEYTVKVKLHSTVTVELKVLVEEL